MKCLFSFIAPGCKKTQRLSNKEGLLWKTDQLLLYLNTVQHNHPPMHFFCLYLKMLSSWRLRMLWWFARCQKSPQGRRRKKENLHKKAWIPFLKPQLGFRSQISFFRLEQKGYFSSPFLLLDSLACGVGWTVQCWRRNSLQSLVHGTIACLPLCLVSGSTLHYISAAW